MSNIYNHRQLVPGGAGGSSRANELLDALRQEFENLSQEASMYKMQRDDLEHKGEFMNVWLDRYYISVAYCWIDMDWNNQIQSGSIHY